MDQDQAYDEIERQIGRSAGHICFYEFHHENDLTETLSRSAFAVWESLRSAWTLVEVWNNGTTVWASPEGDETLTVPPKSDISVNRLPE